MLIRKATPKDIEGIFKTFLEMVKSEDSASKKVAPFLMDLRKKGKDFKEDARKELLREVRERNSLYLVAEDKGKIIGYCYGTVKAEKGPFFKSTLIGHLNGLVVKKQYNGKGIGSKLHRELEKWFKEKKCKQIKLEVFTTNLAKRIYSKLGYHEVISKMNKKL